MTEKDYPNLYQASNKESIESQKLYLHFMRVNLIAAILATMLVMYNFQRVDYLLYIYILSASLFGISGLSTCILWIKKFEDRWYKGRAVAESCKTLSWRFMMKSEYFEISEENIQGIQLQARFQGRIGEVESEYKGFVETLDCSLLRKPYITDKMREVRGYDFNQRKEFYIKERIKNQIDWYSTKGDYNKSSSDKWFIIILISHISAILFTIYLITNPTSEWNIVGVFSTIAASAMSWLQLKQHQELKQAYTTAVLELNKILELSNSIINEESFSKFVLDSENAISREHTLWVVQRRK